MAVPTHHDTQQSQTSVSVMCDYKDTVIIFMMDNMHNDMVFKCDVLSMFEEDMCST